MKQYSLSECVDYLKRTAKGKPLARQLAVYEGSTEYNRSALRPLILAAIEGLEK